MVEHHSSTTKAPRAQVFGKRAGLAFVWNPYILIVTYAFNFADDLGAWRGSGRSQNKSKTEKLQRGPVRVKSAQIEKNTRGTSHPRNPLHTEFQPEIFLRGF